MSAPEPVTVVGYKPLHYALGPWFTATRCGKAVDDLSASVGRTLSVRRIVLARNRRDACSACFPDNRSRVIRLGYNQRALIRRALLGAGAVYPYGRADREALAALLRRGILVPQHGSPLLYRIASETLAIHLRGAVLQHERRDRS